MYNVTRKLPNILLMSEIDERKNFPGEQDCKKYSDLLHNVVTSSNLSVKSIIITHWHPDHLGGCHSVRSLLEGNVNSENISLRLNSADRRNEEIPVYKFPHEYDEKIAPGQKIFPLHDNQVLYA